jgi:hypothetical protein
MPHLESLNKLGLIDFPTKFKLKDKPTTPKATKNKKANAPLKAKAPFAAKFQWIHQRRRRAWQHILRPKHPPKKKAPPKKKKSAKVISPPKMHVSKEGTTFNHHTTSRGKLLPFRP